MTLLECAPTARWPSWVNVKFIGKTPDLVSVGHDSVLSPGELDASRFLYLGAWGIAIPLDRCTAIPKLHIFQFAIIKK